MPSPPADLSSEARGFIERLSGAREVPSCDPPNISIGADSSTLLPSPIETENLSSLSLDAEHDRCSARQEAGRAEVITHEEFDDNFGRRENYQAATATSGPVHSQMGDDSNRERALAKERAGSQGQRAVRAARQLLTSTFNENIQEIINT